MGPAAAAASQARAQDTLASLSRPPPPRICQHPGTSPHRHPAVARHRHALACTAAAAAAVPAATPAATSSSSTTTTTTTTTTADAFDELQRLSEATSTLAVGATAWGGRGLLAAQWLPERSELLTVPLHNALVISDDPSTSISVFSDRQHRLWQRVHGALPVELLEFLQGDARWDARMAAWLLWVLQQPPGPLWRAYVALLPPEREMSCLLNFSAAEAAELQLPELVEEARVQAAWSTHLHTSLYHSKGGRLARLGLSSSLADSLWALGLVRSRTFSEDINGESLTLMVPFCDLANHAPQHNSTFCLSKDAKGFQLRSLQPLGAGEEVTISYGREKPNCDLLRDYGFTLPGNPHDRLKFGCDGSSSSSSSSGVSSSRQERQQASDGGVHGLNAASVLEAAGFAGDLARGKIEPAAPAAAEQPHNALQQLARRRAALLSLPLDAPVGNRRRRDAGLAGWWAFATQPWTEAGRPPPQPIQRGQVASERAAVAQLLAAVAEQAARLPTSIGTDRALLQQAAAQAAAGSEQRQLRRPHVPAVAATQRAGGSSSNRSSSSSSGSGSDVDLSSPRMVAAIQARLEHKLLLAQAGDVLRAYDAYLANRFA